MIKKKTAFCFTTFCNNVLLMWSSLCCGEAMPTLWHSLRKLGAPVLLVATPHMHATYCGCYYCYGCCVLCCVALFSCCCCFCKAHKSQSSRNYYCCTCCKSAYMHMSQFSAVHVQPRRKMLLHSCFRCNQDRLSAVNYACNACCAACAAAAAAAAAPALCILEAHFLTLYTAVVYSCTASA
jgi:hypothetical protein